MSATTRHNSWNPLKDRHRPRNGAWDCGGFDRHAAAEFLNGLFGGNFVRAHALTASILVAVGLAGCSREEGPPRPPATIELDANQLESRDGRLFAKGATQAFSGVLVEHYPDGLIKARSSVVEGRLHGLSEGWHTNGQIQVREHFTNGVSHGLRQKWYADGVLQSEAPIAAGKIDGVFRRWHENGTLAEEVEMHDSQPHGTARAFDAKGTLLREVHVMHGQPVAEAHGLKETVHGRHP